MKKSVLWTIVIVIILLAIGAFIMVAHNSAGSSKDSATAAPSSTIISYICDNQRIIAAEFGTSSMTMALSDGRSFVLSETASTSTATSTPSSTRYEEGNGTNQDFVFVNGGGTAYFMENGSTTYSNCIMNATPAQTSSTSATG
jgi:membrane-bound inhibitor of C-type lysozyme